MAPDTSLAPPGEPARQPGGAAPPTRLNPRVLLLAFMVLAAAIFGAAWWMAGELAAAARSAAARHLATIVDLRMEQLTDWQSDRAADAKGIHGDTVLGEWIDELFSGIASEERIAALAGRIASVREGYAYHAVTLYDRDGRPRLGADDGQPATPSEAADAALVRQALASRQVVQSDLMVFARPTEETSPRVTVHLHSAVPLHRHGSDEPVGVMVLSYDATRSLSAYLQGIETSGPRVELRLVPDQPGDAPVLGAGAQLASLERLGPATATAYAESRRVGEAAVATRDEAGRPVLAIARALPDTSWQLVARIETRRIEDANTRERNQLLALALAGLVLVAAVLVALRRDQELNVARTRLAAQASLDESETRFHMFMDNSPAVAFLKDEHGRLLYTNVAFRRAFGFDDDAWFGRATEELWPATTADALTRVDRQVLDTDAPGLFEQEFTDARGTTVWLVSKFPIRDSAGRRFLGGTAVDITERRRQEEALRRRTMALAASSRCGDILAHDLPEAALLAEICRAIVEETGCRLAWVGYAQEDEARSIRAMARAGENSGYVDGLAMSWGDTERGRGPMGAAIRTGRPVVVHDIRTDADFRPWREDAVRRGFASVLGLPLALGDHDAAEPDSAGHVIGALCVYAAQADAFGAEEVALFRELAAKLALGIARERERAERRRVEAALARSNAELQRLAMQDALTGVSNRRHFTAVAERDIALARRQRRPLSVLMIDIDHFKAVNDTHGHAVGDEVLRGLVGVMQTVLRATDHLGRHGGEEFVVLLPDTTLDGAADAAERLRAAVAATPLHGRDGAPLACTVSVGVTEWTPADPSIEAALRRADAALYDAKSVGRNAVRCAMPEAATVAAMAAETVA